jgi:uncharacterized protein YukE
MYRVNPEEMKNSALKMRNKKGGIHNIDYSMLNVEVEN